MLGKLIRRLPAAVALAVGLVCCCPALGQPEPGHWAFSPARDTFIADALLDLRGLNEMVAGMSFNTIISFMDFPLSASMPKSASWGLKKGKAGKKP